MVSVAGFGDQVYPKVSGVSDEVNILVDRFVGDTKASIAAGVNNITCMVTRCIYAPAKNALCVYVHDGAAWWVLSSLCMTIALFFLQIAICVRRRDIKNPKIEDASLSDPCVDFRSVARDHL